MLKSRKILWWKWHSSTPVHILLVGEPGIGKTQFLLAIKDRFKNKSSYVIGANATKAGLVEALFRDSPKYLLIDEIETLDSQHQEALLNLMETGIVSETKKTSTRETKMVTWVFATSNGTDLLEPLLSRFLVLHLKAYTDDEFKQIAVSRLLEEGINEDLAMEIAAHETRTYEKTKQNEGRG
ncbi:MAG: AAA family ATPase [Nitrososphaerota archaeon]